MRKAQELIIGAELVVPVIVLVALFIASLGIGRLNTYPPPPLPRSITDRIPSDVAAFEKSARDRGVGPVPAAAH